MEVQGKKKQLDAGIIQPKFVEDRSVGLRAGTADNQRGLGGFYECGSVAEIFCGHNVVAGAFEQSAKVGEEIAGAFDAQDLWLGGMRRSLGMLLTLGKSVNRLLFGIVDVEHPPEFRGFKDFFEERRELAEFEVAPRGPQRPNETNESSEAAAIEKVDVSELENKVFRFEGMFFDFEEERARFIAGSDAAATANDDNIAAKLRLQIKLH